MWHALSCSVSFAIKTFFPMKCPAEVSETQKGLQKLLHTCFEAYRIVNSASNGCLLFWNAWLSYSRLYKKWMDSWIELVYMESYTTKITENDLHYQKFTKVIPSRTEWFWEHSLSVTQRTGFQESCVLMYGTFLSCFERIALLPGQESCKRIV